MAYAQTGSLRDDALGIFKQVVKAADPAHALRKNCLPILSLWWKKGGRTYLVAIGKAALPCWQRPCTTSKHPMTLSQSPLLKPTWMFQAPPFYTQAIPFPLNAA